MEKSAQRWSECFVYTLRRHAGSVAGMEGECPSHKGIQAHVIEEEMPCHAGRPIDAHAFPCLLLPKPKTIRRCPSLQAKLRASREACLPCVRHACNAFSFCVHAAFRDMDEVPSSPLLPLPPEPPLLFLSHAKTPGLMMMCACLPAQPHSHTPTMPCHAMPRRHVKFEREAGAACRGQEGRQGRQKR